MAKPRSCYRKLNKTDRRAHWYPGDLPTDRPTAGERVSEQEWISLVEPHIETRPDGIRVLTGTLMFDDQVIVWSAEWFQFLYRLALSLQRPLFWEPRKSVRRQPKVYRKLSDAEKSTYWYVDLPDDRPTSGRRVSEEEWVPLVGSVITTCTDGIHILRQPLASDDEPVIVVGSPEWCEWLVSFAMSLRRRLFWEPRHSVGLTEEGARRYGYEESDAARRARLARQAAKRKARRAEKQAAQHHAERPIGPSVFD